MKNDSLLIALLLSMALSSCATRKKEAPPPAPPQVIEVPTAKLSEPPTQVMEKREANFRERLLDFFSPKPTEPTILPASSPPRKPE